MPNKHLDGLLDILRRRLLPQLPKCSKNFLNTINAEYFIQPMKDFQKNDGQFVYLGIQKGLQTCLNIDLHPTRVLGLNFNIDGVQITKSSGRVMWPIL